MKLYVDCKEFENIKKFFVVCDPADICVKKSGKIVAYSLDLGYIPLWRCSGKKKSNVFPIKTFGKTMHFSSNKCFKYDPDNRVILSGFISDNDMKELIDYKKNRLEKHLDDVIEKLMSKIGTISDTTKIPIVRYPGSHNKFEHGILINTVDDIYTVMTNENSFYFECKEFVWDKNIKHIGFIGLDDIEKIVKSKLIEFKLMELMEIPKNSKNK